MYVLLLDQLERQVLADRQGLIAAGVREGLPNLRDAQERFDAALHDEPAALTPVDREQLELRIALGVA